MTNQTEPRAYQILAAIDFSELSNLALEQAIALSTHHPVAKLNVVTVAKSKDDGIFLPGSATPTQHAAQDLKEHVVEQMRLYERSHGKLQLSNLAVFVAIGKPAERILAIAKSVDADVIVMGTHGRQGMNRLLEGSVAEEVLRGSTCGVYAVHEGTRHPPERSAFAAPENVDVLFDGKVDPAAAPSA